MATKDDVLTALAPIAAFLKTLSPGDAASAAKLSERFPLKGPELTALRELVREGVESKWLCERENQGVRFGRIAKELHGFTVDAVHMSSAGAGHTHPDGEFDLCFAASGAPRFDASGEGWTVYGPNTWHVPSVSGGAMDILYFLPAGALRFEEKPADAVGVGLQA